MTDGTQYQLRLRRCPFREVAENHQDVVCPLHLGLMQGALAQMRAPVTADRLEPFAEPSLCIAYLATPQSRPARVADRREGGPGMHPDIRVRRVYDDPEPEDGTRVLVDRVWPRGLRKDAAHLDDWAKDVAPSSELRTWYGHDPAKFGEFRNRYTAELAQGGPQAALGRLRALAAEGPVTLLTATKDIGISQAAVLAQLLQHSE